MHVDIAAIQFLFIYMGGGMLLQDAVVQKMKMCARFGASRIGADFENVYALSKYVTFCAISTIAVREMDVRDV